MDLVIVVAAASIVLAALIALGERHYEEANEE